MTRDPTGSRSLHEAEQLVPDELWQAIEPLLPAKRPPPRGGQPWIGDRAVLGGIVYLLRTRVPWRLLPAQELGGGSPVTCWRRLRTWQAAGVWTALHTRLLDWLGDDGSIDWSRASVDSVAVRAKRRGLLTGPNPVDRGKAGAMYHLLTDAGGLPLAIAVSAANTHDSLLLEPLVDAVPAVVGPRGRPGRPRRRPAKLHADKGDDYPRCRRALRGGASRRGSSAGGWSRVLGGAGTAGWWSARRPGCSASGCRSATNGPPTYWLACRTWPAR